MSEILEALMVISFGLSWPFSIIKSYKARTAVGKSLLFISFILFGYACGIAWKLYDLFCSGKSLQYPFIFYVLNFIMISIELIIYFCNRAIDKKNLSVKKS